MENDQEITPSVPVLDTATAENTQITNPQVQAAPPKRRGRPPKKRTEQEIQELLTKTDAEITFEDTPEISAYHSDDDGLKKVRTATRNSKRQQSADDIFEDTDNIHPERIVVANDDDTQQNYK